MTDTEFAAVIEAWTETSLAQALSEFTNDYSVDKLVLILAELRRRGVEPPAGLGGLEPCSDAEREALESLQHARVAAAEANRMASKKWTMPLVIGVGVLIAVTFFAGVDATIGLLIAIPVIACVVVADQLLKAATKEGLGDIFRGDLD